MLFLRRLYSLLPVDLLESHVAQLVGPLTFHKVHDLDEVSRDLVLQLARKTTLPYVVDGRGFLPMHLLRQFLRLLVMASSADSTAGDRCLNIGALVLLALLEGDGEHLLDRLLLEAGCGSDARVVAVIEHRLGDLGGSREVTLLLVLLVLRNDVRQLDVAMVASLPRICQGMHLLNLTLQFEPSGVINMADILNKLVMVGDQTHICVELCSVISFHHSLLLVLCRGVSDSQVNVFGPGIC